MSRGAQGWNASQNMINMMSSTWGPRLPERQVNGQTQHPQDVETPHPLDVKAHEDYNKPPAVDQTQHTQNTSPVNHPAVVIGAQCKHCKGWDPSANGIGNCVYCNNPYWLVGFTGI